jgi:hypothetical protein
MATRRTFLQDSAALDAGIKLTQAQTVRAAEEPGLHTIYWTSISGKGGEPKGNLAKIIDRNFGSYTKFKAQLVAATIAVEASGWGVVGYHPATGKLVVIRHRCHRHDPSRDRDSRGIEFIAGLGTRLAGYPIVAIFAVRAVANSANSLTSLRDAVSSVIVPHGDWGYGAMYFGIVLLLSELLGASSGSWSVDHRVSRKSSGAGKSDSSR